MLANSVNWLFRAFGERGIVGLRNEAVRRDGAFVRRPHSRAGSAFTARGAYASPATAASLADDLNR
ncbi:MAG TPA: hypothetical protein VGW38_12685 [Chloroflexota bacterium]|nr:hypothetical protein [Chloroflexota bacterium]